MNYTIHIVLNTYNFYEITCHVLIRSVSKEDEFQGEYKEEIILIKKKNIFIVHDYTVDIIDRVSY